MVLDIYLYAKICLQLVRQRKTEVVACYALKVLISNNLPIVGTRLSKYPRWLVSRCQPEGSYSHVAQASLYTVKGLCILDNDGKRILSKVRYRLVEHVGNI